MANRPSVIAFDVIETLFPLAPIRQRLIEAGQPEYVLDVWFARMLRDSFALVASGSYRPFGEVAAATLRSTAPELDDDSAQYVLAGFAKLDLHPDVHRAIDLAHDAGVRMITLTNGSSTNTRKLLERSGISDYFEQTLSVDDIRRWKPAPEIYLHAARSTDMQPGEVALVAAHAWDTHGAHEAGLTTGWVARLEPTFPPMFSSPDVVGGDLVAVIERLLGLDQPNGSD
jgi:2-haloacid dehalogenase